MVCARLVDIVGDVESTLSSASAGSMGGAPDDGGRRLIALMAGGAPGEEYKRRRGGGHSIKAAALVSMQMCHLIHLIITAGNPIAPGGWARLWGAQSAGDRERPVGQEHMHPDRWIGNTCSAPGRAGTVAARLEELDHMQCAW